MFSPLTPSSPFNLNRTSAMQSEKYTMDTNLHPAPKSVPMDSDFPSTPTAITRKPPNSSPFVSEVCSENMENQGTNPPIPPPPSSSLQPIARTFSNTSAFASEIDDSVDLETSGKDSTRKRTPLMSSMNRMKDFIHKYANTSPIRQKTSPTKVTISQYWTENSDIECSVSHKSSSSSMAQFTDEQTPHSVRSDAAEIVARRTFIASLSSAATVGPILKKKMNAALRHNGVDTAQFDEPSAGTSQEPTIASSTATLDPFTTEGSSDTQAQQRVDSGSRGNEDRVDASEKETKVDNEDLILPPKPTQLKETNPTPDSINDEGEINDDEECDNDDNSMAADDTCFSTFSAVHNADMTQFARLGQSPTHLMACPLMNLKPKMHPESPVRTRVHARSPLKSSVCSNDSTNLLIDFTQQVDITGSSSRKHSPTRRNSPTKMATEPNLLAYIHQHKSPGKQDPIKERNRPGTPLRDNGNGSGSKSVILNLLDFDLPPAPTPRSVPSITVRELETLKSNYQSQVSALKATLSGREAEVMALKQAVADAERRVGAATEAMREERSAREHVEREKAAWEARRAEFEEVLENVRAEVLRGEREHEKNRRDLAVAEKRVEEAEKRAEEAEKRRLAAATTPTTVTEADGTSTQLFTLNQVQEAIDAKVHALSTELHSIYKKKHVNKVAGLKKGFEDRARRITTDLREQNESQLMRIKDLEQENADLKQKVVDQSMCIGEVKEYKPDLVKEDYELSVAKEEIAALRDKVVSLEMTLARERTEKSELVAAVDEMLSLQTGDLSGNEDSKNFKDVKTAKPVTSKASTFDASVYPAASTANPSANSVKHAALTLAPTTPTAYVDTTVATRDRKTVASRLRGPQFSNNGGSFRPPSVSSSVSSISSGSSSASQFGTEIPIPQSYKSRIMSNIERMGNNVDKINVGTGDRKMTDD